MDKEMKKAIRKFLWLDDVLNSSDSLWGILDEIEDELEDMFGGSRKPEEIFKDFFRLNKENK